MNRMFKATIDEPTLMHRLYTAWKEQHKSIEVDLSGKELEDYVHYRSRLNGLPVNPEDLQGRRVINAAVFSKGVINISTTEPIPLETVRLLERFAGVFDGTYTRFLDLKQAEAQAEEARIETALEKVRSRSLAMHKSEELQEVVNTVFERLKELDIEMDVVSITLFTEGTRDVDQWNANPGNLYSTRFHLPYFDLSMSKDILEAKESGTEFFAKHYTFEEKNEWFSYAFQHTDFKHIPEERKTFILERKSCSMSGALSKNTGILLISFSGNLFSEKENEIQKRFSKVFEQAYIRFLDLTKAEAQAHEAKIEASLERVRGKAMAMHNSDDLSSTIGVFYHELESLSVRPRRCGLGLVDKESHTSKLSTMNTTEQGETVVVTGKLSMHGHPVLEEVYNHWIMQKEYRPVLRGNEIKAYYQVIRPQVAFPDYPNDVVQYGYYFFFPEGDVYAWTEKELAEEDLQIYRRFTTVLSLTYKRYNDLKLAEEQAREATIEAALEKVRGKAMAMHNSSDLVSTASQVFTELRKLGIQPMRCGVSLHNKENRKNLLYSATSSGEGDSLSLVGWAMLEGHPVLSGIYDHWLRGEDYFPVLNGEALKSYYEKIKYSFVVPENTLAGIELYGYFLPFSEGSFYAWSTKPFNESEIKILNRFKAIIALTFRRYIELQKAEANALEAIRKSSLDRVRAEIASMRTSDDLQRITPLVWRELTTLGVPFFRCGVMIVDEREKKVQFYLTTPDGKPLAALHLKVDNVDVTQNAFNAWQMQKVYTDHWDKQQFQAFAKSMLEQGQIQTATTYQGGDEPPESLTLLFVPFAQGMMYVGSAEPLPSSQIELVQALAEAFSVAYARYEDFNKLETAKQQVEKTLTDLKQAQTQLIQSEKMASLGELTAGIAHEIKNPLNFVNNFAEVSNELLDEMNAELDKGNAAQAKAIATDLIQNLEKINFHGKRADAIVKSMLQHSRSGNDKKELTDINALADEYLRLSYHGLRARDKSFNAAFKSDFDPGIGKINVVSQDIGRVILNLLTNAFYAVNEKRNVNIPGYEPTVTVSTKKVRNGVEIRVADNGNGIPRKVMDKIFQPFFTTKPTGQGTGLGLSLSYDIVTKGHGGELKVETKEGEGSAFIIVLPLS